MALCLFIYFISVGYRFLLFSLPRPILQTSFITYSIVPCFQYQLRPLKSLIDMYLYSTVLLTTLSLLTLTSAHFTIEYPEGRGESTSSQPCGGYGITKRTPWPLTGGEVKFETEHDQSKTEVWLYIGDNPQATSDFTINLKPVFLQIGLGTFCWNSLSVPNGTAGVKNGADATIQLRLNGPDGPLYAVSFCFFFLPSSFSLSPTSF